MARVYTYSVIAVTLALLFSFAGIGIGQQDFLTNIGLNITAGANTSVTNNLSTGNIFLKIFGSAGIWAGIGIAAALAVSFFTKASPENYLILPFITASLSLFVGFMINLITYITSSQATIPSWELPILIIVLAPFTVGYMISLVEFWRGTA